MNAPTRGGTQTREQCSPPWRAARCQRVARSTWLPGALIPRFLCGLRLASVSGGARAAHIEVSAAVSSSEASIWGVSDPLCHPQEPGSGPQSVGSRTPGMGVTVVRQNRARSVTSPSEPRVSRAMPLLFPSNVNTTDRFCRKAAFIIGERALPPNQRPRRSPTVTSCLSSNPRVSFVGRFSTLSDLMANRCGMATRIVRRSSALSSHSASLRPPTGLRARQGLGCAESPAIT